jgi:hypothetical protein
MAYGNGKSYQLCFRVSYISLFSLASPLPRINHRQVIVVFMNNLTSRYIGVLSLCQLLVFLALYSICTMSINVNIDCSSLPERSDILDFYRPKLQKFPSHHYRVEPEKAKQIDVSSTWKGLHLSHAYELQFWERATKAALESYLEESLITLFVNEEPEIGWSFQAI